MMRTIIAVSDVSQANFALRVVPAIPNLAAAPRRRSGRNVLSPVDAESPTPRRRARARAVGVTPIS
jgi:hypothetical protein